MTRGAAFVPARFARERRRQRLRYPASARASRRGAARAPPSRRPDDLPGRLAVAGEGGPRRLRSGREPAPRDHIDRPDGSRRPAACRILAACAATDHEPVGSGAKARPARPRPDHRVETGLLGGGGEADDAVEPCRSVTASAGRPSSGPAPRGRPGRRPLEEGEARVSVELGIGSAAWDHTGSGGRTAARPSRRRGRIKIEQTFEQVKPQRASDGRNKPRLRRVTGGP